MLHLLLIRSLQRLGKASSCRRLVLYSSILMICNRQPDFIDEENGALEFDGDGHVHAKFSLKKWLIYRI